MTLLNNAPRYFCLRISKKIYREWLLSCNLGNPERYFSISSQWPLVTSSSKYLTLKNNPVSCSSLANNWNEYNSPKKRNKNQRLHKPTTLCIPWKKKWKKSAFKWKSRLRKMNLPIAQRKHRFIDQDHSKTTRKRRCFEE